MIGRTHIWTGLLVLALWACSPAVSDNQPDKPKDLIPVKKMTQMLVDVHIIEGGRSGTRVLGDSANVDVYYRSFFDKYAVSKEQYESSFDYYSHFPEKMMEMYDVVIDSLNLREIRISEEVRRFKPEDE